MKPIKAYIVNTNGIKEVILEDYGCIGYKPHHFRKCRESERWYVFEDLKRKTGVILLNTFPDYSASICYGYVLIYEPKENYESEEDYEAAVKEIISKYLISSRLDYTGSCYADLTYFKGG